MASFPATLAVSSLNGSNGFRIDRVAADSGAGDVNAEGRADRIIGAPGVNGSTTPVTGTFDPDTLMANGMHILARGDTHLPFAKPRFGTPCAALLPSEDRRRESEYAAMMMGDMDSGMMGETDADPTRVDDD